MLEPTATAVHQVSVLVTDALVGTQLCALDEWEKGWGRIKGKEDKEKCREQETHISPESKREGGQLVQRSSSSVES